MKVFFYLFLFLGMTNFASAQTLDWYTNNFTTKLEEGGAVLPRADSLKDLGMRVAFEESYLKYDIFMIGIYCKFGGSDKDQLLLLKRFIPSSNEFKVKYGEKKAYDFWVLNPNGGKQLVGDFDDIYYSYLDGLGAKANIVGLPKSTHGFHVIVKGYLKTGAKNRTTDYYGNVVESDAYDEGTILASSISFDLRWKTRSQK